MYAFEHRISDANGGASALKSPQAWPSTRPSLSRFSRSDGVCNGQEPSPFGTLQGSEVGSALDACFESLYNGQALPQAAPFLQDWQPHDELKALNTKQLQTQHPPIQALQGLPPSPQQQHPLQQHPLQQPESFAHTPFGMGCDPPKDGPLAGLHTTPDAAIQTSSDLRDSPCELSDTMSDSPSLPLSPSEHTEGFLSPLSHSGLHHTNAVTPGAQPSGHPETADCAQGGGANTGQKQSAAGASGPDAGLAKRRLAKRDSARRVRARKKEQLNALSSELQELLASKAALEAGHKEVDSCLPELKHKVEATVSDTMQVQGKNEVLRMEADMLQRMAAGVKYRLQSVMGSRMGLMGQTANPLVSPKPSLAFSI